METLAIFSIAMLSENSRTMIGADLKDNEFIEQVSHFIDENLHTQDFGMNMIGDEFGLSRSKLYKKFKEITNITHKDSGLPHLKIQTLLGCKKFIFLFSLHFAQGYLHSILSGLPDINHECSLI